MPDNSNGRQPLLVNDDYETGYREGASSLVADIRMQFTEFAGSMDDLLEFFRTVTGDPDLEWPGGASGG